MNAKTAGILLVVGQLCGATLTWDTAREQLKVQLQACKLPVPLTVNAALAEVQKFGADIATCAGCLGEQFNKAAIQKLNTVVGEHKQLKTQVAQAKMSADGELNEAINKASFGSVAPQSAQMFTQFVEQRLIPVKGDDDDAAHIVELLTIAKQTVVMLAKILTQDIEQIPLVFGKQSGPDFDDEQQKKALEDMTEIAASTIRDVIISYDKCMTYASEKYVLNTDVFDSVNFLGKIQAVMIKRGETKQKYDKMQAIATQYNSLFGTT